MVFSSLEFIFIFLPIFLVVYAFTDRKYKNAVIFLGSIVFYSVGVIENPLYILLFLSTIVVNFIVGEFIYNFPEKGKIWLIVGIVFDFWGLVFFKYSGFITENVNSFFKTGMTVKDIILPVGISFYTFQNVSYIIDVYRKTCCSEHNFINYGAYISMFPQLIAGPIVTYQTVSEQLASRKHTAKKVENGLKRFTIGLGMKVIIANQIGGLWRDITQIGFQSISPQLAWMGIFGYSFQLYFDFYGYSLMAMGLGEIMGFDIPQNFNNPYISVTMTEFWRRWHITLGSWFREYIYIPLGGSREGSKILIRNTLVVWLFTGLWHGASWNFVLWGLVLCAVILLEKFFIGDFMKNHRVVGHIYMILLIPLTWLIFAVTDFHQLGVYFRSLTPFFRDSSIVIPKNDYIKYFGIYGKYFVAGTILSTGLLDKPYEKIKNSVFGAFLHLAIFWTSVYCMYMGMDDIFMYYRF